MNYFRSITLFLAFLSCAPIAQSMQAPLLNPNISQEKLSLQDIKRIREPRNIFLNLLPSDLVYELYRYYKGGINRMRDFWLLKHQENNRFSQKEIDQYASNLLCTPDNKFLIAASYGSITVYDLQNLTIIQRFNDACDDYLRCVAYDGKNCRVFSTTLNNTIKIWDIKSGSCLGILEGHAALIESLVFDQKNNILFSASKDSTIKVWNLKANYCEITIEHCDAKSLAFDSITNHLYIAASKWPNLGSTIKVWDLTTKSFLDNILESDNHNILIAVNEQQRKLFIYDSKGIHIWNIDAGSYITVANKWNADCVFQGIPDINRNRLILSCMGYPDFTKGIIILDLETQTALFEKYGGRYSRQNVLAFDPQTNRLFVENGNRIKIWFLEDSLLKSQLQTQSPENQLLQNELFEQAYACFKNKKPLDLESNKNLLELYYALPVALQKTLTRLVVVEPAVVPIAPAPAVAKQTNNQDSKESWSEWLLGKPNK